MSQFKQYLRESIDHALSAESPSGWDTTPLDWLLWRSKYGGNEEAKRGANLHYYKQAEAYYGSEVWNNLTQLERDNLAQHFIQNPVGRPLYLDDTYGNRTSKLP